MILLKWCLTLNISTLTDEEAEELEGDITYSEEIILSYDIGQFIGGSINYSYIIKENVRRTKIRYNYMQYKTE